MLHAGRNINLLAIDDTAIPFTHNLRLEMHRPVKHPDNPLLSPGSADMPDGYGAQFYGSVVEDEGKFKAWYVAIDPSFLEKPGSFATLRPAYAESADGIHWTKPELGLVEYNGSRKNNLVLIEDGPLNVINLKVLVEPDDPDPSRRFKMTGQTRCAVQKENKAGGFQEKTWGTLVPLISADGLHWRLAIDAKPLGGLLPKEARLLPEHHFEAAGGLYKWNGMYYASGQSGGGLGDWGYTHGTRPYSGREVMMHRSPDFVTWSKTSHVGFIRHHQHAKFQYGHGEESHEGASVWNRGNVLLGLYGIWHGGADWEDITLDMGLLVSNDGIRFREPTHEWPLLERGPDGAWDQGGVIQGQGFANIGDETRIYYGAWDPRNRTATSRGGIGLATLPRDRFGSLKMQKANGEAELITMPVSVDGGSRILVNASGLSQNALLRVELLDRLERPLDGYSGNRAARVREAGFASPVEWSSSLPDGQDAVRIKLTYEGDARHQIALHAIYVNRRGA